MSLNKKGVWENISNLILILVIAFILIGVFLIGYKTFLFSAGNVAACKNWVNIQATPFLKEVADFASPCVTTEEVIKDDDKNKIYEQLAKNMYTCWDQYGRGEVDFYSDYLEFDSHCRICSEIKVDESIKDKKLNVDDFEIYLSNHRPPNHRETYAEFFTNAENTKIDFGEGTLDISRDNGYYSMFRVSKSMEPLSEQLTRLGVGAVLGGIFGGVVGGTIGFFTGGPPGAITGLYMGGQYGIGIGGVLTGTAELARTGAAFPTLMLIKKDDPLLNKVCDDVYYNPQELIK